MLSLSDLSTLESRLTLTPRHMTHRELIRSSQTSTRLFIHVISESSSAPAGPSSTPGAEPKVYRPFLPASRRSCRRSAHTPSPTHAAAPPPMEMPMRAGRSDAAGPRSRMSAGATNARRLTTSGAQLCGHNRATRGLKVRDAHGAVRCVGRSRVGACCAVRKFRRSRRHGAEAAGSERVAAASRAGQALIRAIGQYPG